MEFIEKNIGSKEFSVDIDAKINTMKIIKHYNQCFNKKCFWAKSFVSFCRERFSDYLPPELTNPGIYKRLKRLEKNNLLKSIKISKKRLAYCLTPVGIKRMNNIEFLKGGIKVT